MKSELYIRSSPVELNVTDGVFESAHVFAVLWIRLARQSVATPVHQALARLWVRRTGLAFVQ